jgi:hypothetical protein
MKGEIALRLMLPGSGDRLTIAFPKMTALPPPHSESLKKGDRPSEASEGQADKGTAGAKAIAFPTPHHRQSLSLLSCNHQS